MEYVLALLGYIANGQKDMIERYSHELGVAIVIILVAAIVLYAFFHRRKRQ